MYCVLCIYFKFCLVVSGVELTERQKNFRIKFSIYTLHHRNA